MEQNVFPAAVAELEDVLFLQFDVPTRFDPLVVQERTVGRAQINDVWNDP